MIRVMQLSAKLGIFTLKDINLTVKGGECLTIVGPNGSGKTTLLECIAGLRRTEQGRIVIGDTDVTYMPPEKRRVGYVPQDYVLFPHLNVEQNITFGLRYSKDGVNRAREIMNWLGINHIANRNVRNLSGGEKQKVALARALAINPKALLLDEPLAALDPLSRERLRKELKELIYKILNTLSIPTIYVTHDLSEAELIGDHVAVMNRGKIEQIGIKSEVFEKPSSKFVAEFLGYNIFPGRIVECKDGVVVVDVNGVLLQALSDCARIGEDVNVALRPQNIILSHTSEEFKQKWQHCRCNIIKGSILEVYRVGALVKVLVDVGIQLATYVSASMLDEFELGSDVFVHFKADDVKLLR